ncbi:MAG: sugar ABC transporter substrate-binding protein [Candidatus Omnitrophota bacterium]|nr:MAG: sugar ABC transporter substrate-binding protein [Candidatus Omnitrophota bacterium]
MSFSHRLGRLIFVLLFMVIGCAPKAPEKKITVWHWMNDRKEAFETLAKKYEELTGIPVKFKLFFPPDIYAQKVIAAARAGNLPEVFGILGEKKMLASFINAGHILDLTDYMQENSREWERQFYPKTLAVTSFKKANTYQIPQGIYGVPIDTTVMEFLYNKTLFRKAGLNPEQPPKTFQDFIYLAKRVQKATKEAGFVCGWGEGWLLNALATEWAINLMGERKFYKTIKGEVSYTDPDWIKVFSLFSQLKDSNILISDITTLINKESEDLFSQGKAAFSFNGSWSVNVYKQLAPDLEFAFFPLPSVSKRFPAKIWGGAGSSFMISAKSPNLKEAVDFLKWLTAQEQQSFLVKETNNLPAVKGCEEILPPILAMLLDDFDILTHPNTWPDNEDTRVLEIMNQGLQQIVMGSKTAQEVAREIQEVKERVCAR